MEIVDIQKLVDLMDKCKNIAQKLTTVSFVKKNVFKRLKHWVLGFLRATLRDTKQFFKNIAKEKEFFWDKQFVFGASPLVSPTFTLGFHGNNSVFRTINFNFMGSICSTELSQIQLTVVVFAKESRRFMSYMPLNSSRFNFEG